MPTPRFGYLTTNLTNLRKARELALPAGYVVDMLPPDAPPPAPGTFDGLIAEVAGNARHALARKTFLERLVRLARTIPVVVHDLTLNYEETKFLRAGGVKWYGSLKETAFAALLASPLAAKATVPPGDAGPGAAPPSGRTDGPKPGSPDSVGSGVTSAAD